MFGYSSDFFIDMASFKGFKLFIRGRKKANKHLKRPIFPNSKIQRTKYLITSIFYSTSLKLFSLQSLKGGEY